MNTAADYEEMVRGPGKFEGEPAYVAYLWECTLCGRDDSSTYYCGHEVSIYFNNGHDPADDRLFPDMWKDTYAIGVYKDDNGFVNHLEWKTKEDYDKDYATMVGTINWR